MRLVLDAVGEICQELFNADTYVIALADERTQKIRFARVVENGKEIQHEDVDMDQGLTGRVLKTGKPIFSRDLQRDRVLKPRMLSAGDPEHPVHSVMVAPLKDKGRPIGVFSVQSHDPSAFRPFQEELFLSVSHQVAAAILSARLYKRATEDSLTRLYNKSFFEERLRMSVDQGDPLGLLFLDCDDFKAINDRFGHVTGDQYLKKLGRLLARESRAGDVPCRYGGDEFAILLPHASRQQTLKAAERIRKKVQRMPFRIDGASAGTTVSVGALWSKGNGSSLPVQDILKRIDDSLYKAKERKNAVELTTL
jgi:diguanylate cyclase (GGDEF)-like protein